jgi:hypothetical protein
MSIWELVKYFAIGIGLKLVFTFVLGNVPYLFLVVYAPWVFIGELIDPTRGPGSHAMISLGTLGSLVIGFFVYSFQLGLAYR